MATEGDTRDRNYELAKDWGKPRAEGVNGEIFSQMRANHVFGRHLTTGDFRQDLLIGLDSKANLKVAILEVGCGAAPLADGARRSGARCSASSGAASSGSRSRLAFRRARSSSWPRA